MPPNVPRTVLDSLEKLRRAEERFKCALTANSQGMFTGSDYRAIQGNQLLNHAGQTASELEGGLGGTAVG